MRKLVWLAILAGGGMFVLASQEPDFTGIITNSQRPRMAIPDFRGAGDAQNFMAVFNSTLWADVESSGLFNMASKSFYPPRIPQQPADFQSPPSSTGRPKRGQAPPPVTGNGLWMRDWSGAPVEATYLTFGYGAVQNGVFVARGFVFDMRRSAPSEAQVIAKNYVGSVDEAGARKAAHEFSCDIIAQFGGTCIAGSHIYYSHQAVKGGAKEIWGMEADGSNQRQITRYNTPPPGSSFPAVSPDGSRMAFTSYAKGQPAIFVFSVDPIRDLRFYNQRASVNAFPSFTPDGKQIVYASSAPDDNCCRIFISNLDGAGFRPISAPGNIEVEPKVNPKTGNQIAFVSGRSGHAQVYLMNIDGGNVERITDGTGEAVNPAWHPNGKTLAFAWTRGYATGKFNVFVMDVVTKKYLQLTHDDGRNEDPVWAPDGAHLAFMSTRGGPEQIYTMLADGTQTQKLTSQGYNFNPAWGK
jgi:TolB protein